MTELCDLAKKWGTDKALYYTPLYHELMVARRETVTKVLEFGIGYPSLMLDAVKRIGREDYLTGASLFMWRDYFPNAQIMALDCNPSALVNEERIRSLWCDQSMSSTYPMEEIGWNFDLIVEDGSHFQPDQILCAQQLVPLLKNDGVYVMEDVTPGDELFIELVRDSVVGECTVLDFGEGTGDPARVIVIRK